MSQIQTGAGSTRLTRQMWAAYCAALLLIAGMATASYLLLDRKLSEHRQDRQLLSMVSAQGILSQRVLFLAGQVDLTHPETRRVMLAALRDTVERFERNYDTLVALSSDTSAPSKNQVLIQEILYEAPYHLDHFTTEMVTRTRRFVAATELESTAGGVSSAYPARSELQLLDTTVANAVLRSYDTLQTRLEQAIDLRMGDMLASHRLLFQATLALLVLVAIFIFRPMVGMIGRRTRELVDARNSMAFIAAHDGLTGLHNRAFLVDHFPALIAAADRRSERLAVLQIDLDGFKQINDTLGHAAGDFVLACTAERLRQVSRAADMCVRLGGDEFVMILSGLGDPADIELVARRVLDRINTPIDFEGITIHCAASAGVAVYPVDADNAGDILVHADLALYNAKKLGGSAFCFFSDDLRRELEHRKLLERDLRVAIDERAFDVHFQPQLALATGKIAGVEALVRWTHAERGMVSPGEFIPIAEVTGLMAQIGRIIITKAVDAAAAWHRDGIEFGRLAINVSGTELREADFEAFLFETLDKAGLPIDRLSLEIVESVILDDERTGIAAKLRRIRSAGVHLELDDFGTGYASLSHVNPNEIDRLKIDRRFVQKINTNGDNTAIVKAITELAGSLGIAIVAEGAETQEEIESLLRIGCDQVQGYSIAFPMPDFQAREWLQLHSSRTPALKVEPRFVA